MENIDGCQFISLLFVTNLPQIYKNGLTIFVIYIIIELIKIQHGGLDMFDKVKQLLVDELQIDPDIITPDAELSKDLNINSIELADLIMMCEEKFDIEVTEDDANRFVTVGDVVSYLETL